MSSAPPETLPEGLVLDYDPDLPISAAREEILAALRAHPVVIVAGETGSGKTTQLPKMCLELGRRAIAHTQPRRIAARSVAERVAEELHTPLGEAVGYQVRFTRVASRATRLKVVTDGVLLAEITHDRDLRRYDTVIIDEAHERSLNIDFLLGYLAQLRARRPDLKIIVTSATIDTARFAAHFAAPDGTPAPVIEVSGRTYPVQVRYRPTLVDGQNDQVEGITAAVRELAGLGGGDILVFLSGEREIRDAAEAVAGLRLPGTEVLPLYARLSAPEQHRVFAPHAGRRVVLATNVAETSLTVPGIRYVVDVGTARISRYSTRTKVQRLPIEPVSRASADQRAGRCGRVAPGVCIRLYSEEDYAARPEFTEPEILRTNLASVILQMAAADLGDVATFPFVEAPDAGQITDGLRLLTELGALSASPSGSKTRPRLSGVGRRLAAIPVDPRMGRMLLAAEREGCLRELLVIVAGLAIPDPRERPVEQRDRADALHRRFWAPAEPKSDPEDRAAPPDGSDFVALLRLWDYLLGRQRALSGNAFRRLCRDEFLHFLRVREWQDLHAQLKEVTRELGLERNTALAPADRVHRAVLSGLLSHVGLAEVWEEKTSRAPGGRKRRSGPREYLGARGTRFALSPGSSLASVAPPLVVAAEIVETTRLWARTVAAVTPRQVEEMGADLVKRSYAEPHWSATAGTVMAYEQVSLYGVPIVVHRRVPYARVNPAEAREIFLRSALVEGQWRTRHPFLAANAATRAEAEALEERTRRRDLVVDDQAIFDFYAARLPAEVTSAAAFDRWWKGAREGNPDLLTLTLADLLVAGAPPATEAEFPDVWDVGGSALPVRYVFDPGTDRDGVSVEVPVSALNQLDPAPFTWQVPGLRLELATELIRTLPKSLRRAFVPAPNVAAQALDWLHHRPDVRGTSFPVALGRALQTLTGESVPPQAWQPDAVPSHLRVGFVVFDGEQVLGSGKDLAALRTELAGHLSATLEAAAAELIRTGATTWDFGTLAESVELERGGRRVVGYPALVDEGDGVGLTVLDTPARARASSRTGLRRLVLLDTPDPTRWVVGHLRNTEKLALAAGPYPSVPDLLADARLAAVGELVRQHAPHEVRDPAAYGQLRDAVRAELPILTRALVVLAAEICTRHSEVRAALPAARSISPTAAEDVAEQVELLVFPKFLSATPYEHLVDLPRYLAAASARLTGLRSNPGREAAGAETIARCEDAYAELCAAAPPGRLPADLEEIGWLLEELRVSLFAQTLRTKVPVSQKRVLSAAAAARARLERAG